MPAHDVIVIGVGAIGAATCAALARRGARVLGLDANSIPNDRSSHHGRSRVFRVAYFEHPDYVPLLEESRRAWSELGERTGRLLLHQCGVLYLGDPVGDMVARTTAAAQRHGIDHQTLAREDLAARLPQFRPAPGHAGLFEPAAGWVAAEPAVAALAADARQHGADLRPHAPVRAWEEQDSGVRVKTTTDEFTAQQLIITAGPAASGVLPSLGVTLRVTRQILAWVQPARPERFIEPDFPVWALETPQGLAYGFPLAEGDPGIKLAFHVVGEDLEPNAAPHPATTKDTAPLAQVLADHLPDAMGPIVETAVCRYTNSPDGHYIIDRLPGHARVHFAAGCSGHGFKSAPAIGEALADLATQGKTSRPIGFLNLSRFNNADSSA